MVAALRDAVVAIGEDVLGFKKEQVGTHSIRSGAAMAMYLGECPVYTIMLIGRWSSDAFLRYIRKQVEQFSHNVSKRMLRFLFHRHIPDLEPSTSSPIAAMASLRAATNSTDMMCSILPFLQTAETGVSSVSPV